MELPDKALHGFGPKSLLIIEGLPDIYGAPVESFPGAHIRTATMARVDRAQVRSASELSRLATWIRQYDAIHLLGHTVSGGSSDVRFRIGQDFVSAKQLAGILGAPGKLVTLSACESASSAHYVRDSYEGNPAYLLSAGAGILVIGVIGWLEMSTSDAFDNVFYDYLGSIGRVEDAFVKAKLQLFGDGEKDWWTFTLFGPITE